MAGSAAMDDSRTPHPDELFAANLNELFETRRRPDGERWENSQVAAVIGMSRGGVHKLRNPVADPEGERRGPTLKTITQLAGFFDVDPSWFFRPINERTEPPPPDELTTRLAALGVTHVAAHQIGHDLGQMRATVLQVLAQIEDMESRMNSRDDAGPQP